MLKEVAQQAVKTDLVSDVEEMTCSLRKIVELLILDCV